MFFLSQTPEEGRSDHEQRRREERKEKRKVKTPEEGRSDHEPRRRESLPGSCWGLCPTPLRASKITHSR
jgi:hypothetical protein